MYGSANVKKTVVDYFDICISDKITNTVAVTYGIMLRKIQTFPSKHANIKTSSAGEMNRTNSTDKTLQTVLYSASILLLCVFCIPTDTYLYVHLYLQP